MEVAFFSHHQQVLSSLLLLWTDFSPSPYYLSNLVSHKTTTIAPISNLVHCRGLSLKAHRILLPPCIKFPRNFRKNEPHLSALTTYSLPITVALLFLELAKVILVLGPLHQLFALEYSSLCLHEHIIGSF